MRLRSNLDSAAYYFAREYRQAQNCLTKVCLCRRGSFSNVKTPEIAARLVRALANVCTALTVISLTLVPSLTLAQGKTDVSKQQKAEVEVEQPKHDVAELKEEGAGHWWFTALVSLVTAIVGTFGSLWVAYRARLGAIDQAVHEKRLEVYPLLVKETSRFALYFPRDEMSREASVVREQCTAMGRAMSEWYFESGGLLLSVKARKAYFRLARALTGASSFTEDFKVPKFPNDAAHISVEKLSRYQERLQEQGYNLDNVDLWVFGSAASDKEAPVRRCHLSFWYRLLRSKLGLKQETPDCKRHLEFKDYVFLQRLCSRLRTQLAGDLRGRRRPV